MKRKETYKIKKHRKLILRIVGGLLILFGVMLSCYWLFWLSPLIKRSDAHWLSQLSLPDYWEYIQKKIYRHGWSHDDFGPVGLYGNKGWAEWIMYKATKGEELNNCGDVGHKDDALRHITNQDPTGAKESGGEEDWLAWWKQNKSKSQLEWIRDGFTKYGIKLSLSPKSEGYALLLKLLANEKKNNTSVIPDYVKYNAYRWLRDSGFDPENYVSAFKKKSISKNIIKGIFEYQQFKSISPSIGGVGALSFKNIPVKKLPARNKDKYDKYMLNSYWFTPGNSWKYTVIYSIIFLPIIIGILLLFWSTRKIKESK